MKIAFPEEKNGFQLNSCKFCGIDSFLIVPKLDAEWNQNNLYFRSLIADLEGNVLSCGWPKFFNYGEKPHLYPDPENYRDWTIHEKLDGSLLITDFVNGTFSMRTRGCSSYSVQENAKDFELLSQKYPEVIGFLKLNPHYSLLFEIVTPNNVIVIRPKEIEFYLLGAINKNTLTVVSSSELLEIWRKIGCVPTPKTYQIDNAKDLFAVSQLIKDWKGLEGVVVSYNKNQNRLKIKSDWYLWIHRVKSQLNCETNFVEYYVQSKMPTYENFRAQIEKEFDYEIAIQTNDLIEKVCTAGTLAQKRIERLTEIIHDIRNVDTRKEQAEMIKRNCQPLCAYAFTILDNKPLTDLQWNKLITQELN